MALHSIALRYLRALSGARRNSTDASVTQSPQFSVVTRLPEPPPIAKNGPRPFLLG